MQRSTPKKPLMALTSGNPLKKREEFAVSLRKKKKAEIINERRKRRLAIDELAQIDSQTTGLYRECPLFESEIPNETSESSTLPKISSILESHAPQLLSLETKR